MSASLLITCLTVATAIHASLASSNKLYVKFSSADKDPNHTQGFYELPRSLNRLSVNDGYWNVVEDRWNKDGVAVVCRNNDYRVCLLVDKKNSVAGLQLSVAVADLQKTNAPAKSAQETKTVLGTEVYASTIYFVGQDVLKAGGRDMTENTPTAPDGIFVKIESGLRSLPNKEEDIEGSKHIKQQCFPRMGRHYFYDLSNQFDCATIDTFFALYNEQTHELVGFGYTSFGNATVQENGRPWYEYSGGSAVKRIAPDSPECFVDYVNQHGVHSLHVYISDQPWNLKC